MADLSDVTATLRTLIATALYPTRPATNIQVSPTANVKVRIQVGWPDPGSVQKDKAAGLSTVSIYPLPGERNNTRYEKAWQQVGDFTAPTFTLAQSGRQVTVGGQAPPTYFAHNLAVVLNGKAYLAQSVSGSTPASIAQALYALISVDIPGASINGAAITLPNATVIHGLRIGTQANVGKEVRRQTRTIQLMTLSPTPQDRDAVVKVFDPVLADLPRFTLPDGFGARLIYRDSPFDDFDQKFGVFRRDLRYDVEYPTVLNDIATEAIAFNASISQRGADGSTIAPPISIPTV